MSKSWCNIFVYISVWVIDTGNVSRRWFNECCKIEKNSFTKRSWATRINNQLCLRVNSHTRVFAADGTCWVLMWGILMLIWFHFDVMFIHVLFSKIKKFCQYVGALALYCIHVLHREMLGLLQTFQPSISQSYVSQFYVLTTGPALPINLLNSPDS